MSSVFGNISCPHCGHLGLEISSNSSKTVVFCPGCKEEITDLDVLLNDFQKTSAADLRHTLRGEDLLGQYTSPYSFTPTIEVSDTDRKSMYFSSFFLGLISFTVFYGVLCFFFPLKDIPFLVIVGIFVGSRLADLISTLIGLAMGATETNPMSDPHNISKMIPLQLFQIGILIGISYLLGLISHWLGIGFLFVFSLLGFEAFFANIGQLLGGPVVVNNQGSVAKEMTNRLIGAHIVSIIIVGTIVFFILRAVF
jgi:hypothetical protein